MAIVQRAHSGHKTDSLTLVTPRARKSSRRVYSLEKLHRQYCSPQRHRGTEQKHSNQKSDRFSLRLCVSVVNVLAAQYPFAIEHGFERRPSISRQVVRLFVRRIFSRLHIGAELLG